MDHRFLSMRIPSGADGYTVPMPLCPPGVSVSRWALRHPKKTTGVSLQQERRREMMSRFPKGVAVTCHGIAWMYSMPDTSYDSCNIDHLFPRPVIVTVTHVDALFFVENCDSKTDSKIDGCLSAWPVAAVAKVGYDGHRGWETVCFHTLPVEPFVAIPVAPTDMVRQCPKQCSMFQLLNAFAVPVGRTPWRALPGRTTRGADAHGAPWRRKCVSVESKKMSKLLNASHLWKRMVP
jgi:hypothetical protein